MNKKWMKDGKVIVGSFIDDMNNNSKIFQFSLF